MYLSAIWRYPVKSMGGETLTTAPLSAQGVHGDRIVQVFDRNRRLVTSRTHPALLGHRATLGSDDQPAIDAYDWRTVEAQAFITGVVGDGAQFGQLDDHQFDILPLLVATDGALAAFGRDPRRLRPNLVIGGVDGLAEREWEGRRLQIGDALVQLDDLRGRCVMTTFDPESQAKDPGVLRDILNRFGGTLCLNASVVTPARIDVGDPVTLR